jgi:hypothetical protein
MRILPGGETSVSSQIDVFFRPDAYGSGSSPRSDMPPMFHWGEGCRPAGRVCYESTLLRNCAIFVNRPAPCFGGETLSPYLSVFPPFSVSVMPREPGGKERGKEGKNGGL